MVTWQLLRASFTIAWLQGRCFYSWLGRAILAVGGCFDTWLGEAGAFTFFADGRWPTGSRPARVLYLLGWKSGRSSVRMVAGRSSSHAVLPRLAGPRARPHRRPPDGGGYFGRHAHQPQGTTACASHSFTEGDTKAEGVTTEGFNTEGSAYDKFLKYTAATIGR